MVAVLRLLFPLLVLLLAACQSRLGAEYAPSQAQQLMSQGDALFAQDRSQAALRAYTFAAMAAEEEGALELLVCAASQAATIHFLGRARDTSARAGDDWLAKAQSQVRDDEIEGWVRYRIANGCRELALGRAEEARASFEQAAHSAHSAGLAVQELQASHLVARCVTGEQRATWLKKCIEVAQAAGEKRWEVPLHFNLGKYYEEAGEAAAARAAYEKALDAARALGLHDEELTARWAAGRAARMAGEWGLARDYLEGARRLARNRAERLEGDSSYTWIARCEFELGELLASQGARAQALEHWTAAHHAFLMVGWERDASTLYRDIQARLAAASQ